ncbi:MAG: hypothetical protein LUI39_11465 [Lachnospiraceae bacterium]|nr:hypothetical protein [Lachnospiraceae bacterium]
MLVGIADAGLRKTRSHAYTTDTDLSQTESLPNDKQGEPLSFAVIDDCLNGAMNSALRLCAYIMLFAVLTGIMTHILPVSNAAVLLLTAGIEVSSGIHMIAESSLPYAVKYIAVSALAAFGGWSALAQSAGIAKMDSEMLSGYIKSRVKITLLAILLSAAVLFLHK